MIENKFSSAIIYTLFLLMIITGSINTIANKLQNNSEALGKPYQHVWFITFCMFLGEVICMFFYLIEVYRQSSTKKNYVLLEESTRIQVSIPSTMAEPLKEATPFHLLLPALCDFFGSSIMTFGLTMMSGSVYQMFRGSLIFFTALFSVFFLKNKIYRHHYLAIIFVMSGLICVGVSSSLFPDQKPPSCGGGDSTSNSYTGIILVIIAQIFTATQMTLEEKFMKGYTCNPLKAVGWEGIWGSLIYLILLIIFQYVPCTPPPPGGTNLSSYICSPDDKGNWTLEDTIFAFRQLGNNGLLLFYAILYVFSIAIFNFVGISVTKYASAAARAVVDTVRTIVVWGFFLTPVVDECHRESFQYLQLVGFFILVMGTVIYNEVLVLPFLGFNQYTKFALDKKEKENELNNDTNFSNSSTT